LTNQVASLTVKLDADQATFTRDMERAKKILKGYGRNAKDSESANTSFARSLTTVSSGAVEMAAGFKVAGAALGAVVSIGAAAVAAINSVAGANAQLARDLDAMALRSGVAVAELQTLAYATSEYNISADKAADILKDLTDKTGDFLATGGGEMADFFENIAPQVGLTAQELAAMSGPNALIAVKNALDATNTSAAEQVFYLESIADEASSLIPLLENGGEKLLEMESRLKGLNSALTQSEIARFKAYQLDVDDLSRSWKAFTREAILPWVDELQEGARYLTEIFSEGRKNRLMTTINESHTEMVGLREEIQQLEKDLETAPKFGGVGLIDAFFGRTDASQNISDLIEEKKNKLLSAQQGLKEAQDRLTELQGRPTGDRTGSGGSSLSAGDLEDSKKLEEQGAKRIAQLDQQYAHERDLLALQHQSRLDEINNLQVSEEELTRLGFENIHLLREEYALQEKEFFQKQILEREQDQREADERELERVRRLAERKREAEEREKKQFAATQQRLDQQMLAMQFNVASQGLGLIEATAKEGSAIQKAAFVAQKLMAAAQVYIQGEVAAMAALSLPPIGLGPVAGATYAAGIRGMAAASAGFIVGQAIAGFRELGGGVSAGKSYIVGERGPEVFTPGAGGQITSNSNLARLGGGAGVVVNVHEAPPGTRVEQSEEQGQTIIDVVIGDLEEDGQISRSMQQKFSLERRGF